MTQPLTPREREALRHVAAGRTVKAAACAMLLSQHTVAHLLQSAKHKLGADSLAQAVVVADRAGML